MLWYHQLGGVPYWSNILTKMWRGGVGKMDHIFIKNKILFFYDFYIIILS